MKKQHKHISKFMSLVLRHNPAVIGVQLDDEGWLSVAKLLDGINAKGIKVDLETLKEIVETNDKKRFAFNEDYTFIRANQGHSVQVDVGLASIDPPEFLYHGTVMKFMVTIRADGLKKMSRLHVHLSKDLETATKVGSRRGKPIILEIESKQMHDEGYLFYLSKNGVWLTDHVPAKYIRPND
jgi:putative RNA 2'-phosphotransferase